MTRVLSLSTPYSLKQNSLDAALKAAVEQWDVDGDVTQIVNSAIVFDLSKTFWYDLGATVWLLVLLHRLRRQQNQLRLVLPDPENHGADRVWDFLIRWRFFEVLSECVDDTTNLLDPSQMRFLARQSRYGQSYQTDETGNRVLAHSARMLEMTTLGIDATDDADEPLRRFLQRFPTWPIHAALSYLCGWSLDDARGFADRVLAEGLRNAALHGNGTFTIVSMRVDARHFILAIADNGIGIPASLRSLSPGDPTSRLRDAELIKYFATPEFLVDSQLISLSTRRTVSASATRSGLGLHYLKTFVTDGHGELRVRSGRASVDFTEKGEVATDDLTTSPGTLLRVMLPIKRAPK